jgi:hypothetical protein
VLVGTEHAFEEVQDPQVRGADETTSDADRHHGGTESPAEVDHGIGDDLAVERHPSFLS